MSCEVEIGVENGLPEPAFGYRDGFITAIWRPTGKKAGKTNEMPGKMSGKMSGTAGGGPKSRTTSICDIDGASPSVAALANRSLRPRSQHAWCAKRIR